MVFVSNLMEMDLTCKFAINKFFPWKIRTVFYKNRNFFLRKAIECLVFAEPRVNFNLLATIEQPSPRR